MKNLKFDVKIEQSEDMDFINNQELFFFMNELFRVGEHGFDEALTSENMSLFPMEHGMGSIPFVDDDKRQSARVMADELLRVYADGDSDNIVTNITTFELTDDSGYGVIDPLWLVSEDEDFFKDLMGYILHHKEDLRDCFFHVLHVDEEDKEFHIHSLKVKR